MFTNVGSFFYIGNGGDNIILVLLVYPCRKIGPQYYFCHWIIETGLNWSVGLSIYWMQIVYIGFLLIPADAFVGFLYAMGFPRVEIINWNLWALHFYYRLLEINNYSFWAVQ
jgi:hypothetical protein